ncbi:MAG: endonuclease/exonuclease/phosphatase family protein [Oscillospiraceae bacterium]
MKKVLKRGLLAILGIVLALVLIVGGYILYAQLQYYRIEDFAKLDIANGQSTMLKQGKEYTAVTSNIGFGAYDREYSFFMDTGVMLDGTAVSGKYGKASSKEAAARNTDSAVKALKALDADFYLVQEVDEDATRSFHINQRKALADAFPNHSESYAENFHSAFLMYPFNDPHGKTIAGVSTLADVKTSEAVRRSYPVDNSFFTKFFDLDRCFAVTRAPVEGGGELVIINSHMSAYDKGGTIRASQLKLLNEVLTEELDKGNYVIVGGDFNHALGDTANAFPSQQQFPGWVYELSNADLAKGYSIVSAVNDHEVATCRGADIPYKKGVNFETVVDGFIVSDNIDAQSLNIDTGYEFSDHNPVKLTFKLAA